MSPNISVQKKISPPEFSIGPIMSAVHYMKFHIGVWREKSAEKLMITIIGIPLTTGI